jgi:hypothetical protein
VSFDWRAFLLALTLIFAIGCVCLMPLFAMVNLAWVLGDALGHLVAELFENALGHLLAGLFEAFGYFLVSCIAFALAIWLFMDEKWHSFAWMLLSFLGWLLLGYPVQSCPRNAPFDPIDPRRAHP